MMTDVRFAVIQWEDGSEEVFRTVGEATDHIEEQVSFARFYPERDRVVVRYARQDGPVIAMITTC